MKKSLALAVLAGLFAASAHAAEYQLDKAHADVGFSVRHLGINMVRGTFGSFDGVLHYDGSPESVRINGTVEVTSIDTRIQKRDDHLRSDDFFDVAKHPQMKLESKSARKEGDKIVLTAHLTIKDVTLPVNFEVEVNGPVDSPWGDGARIIGVRAVATIDRQDFGVANTGPSDKLIGNTVNIELNLEGKK